MIGKLFFQDYRGDDIGIDGDYKLAELLLPVNTLLQEYIYNIDEDNEVFGIDIIEYFMIMLTDIQNWGAMPLERANEISIEFYHDVMDVDPPIDWITQAERLHAEFFWAIFRAYPKLREFLINDQDLDFCHVIDIKPLNNGDDGILLTLLYEAYTNDRTNTG